MTDGPPAFGSDGASTELPSRDVLEATPTAEYEPEPTPVGPIYRLFANCEVGGPYSGKWELVSQFVLAPDPESAQAQSTIEPGYGNVLQMEKAYDSYWERIKDNLKGGLQLLEGDYSIEQYLQEDPTRWEHAIYADYIQLLHRAEDSQRWIEQFAGVASLEAPHGETTGIELPEGIGRWEAIPVLNDLIRAQIVAAASELAKPQPGQAEVQRRFHELTKLADQALTIIAEGGAGEDRVCKDGHGNTPMSAGFRIKLTEAHDRSLDNDIFCAGHTKEHIQANRDQGRKVTVTHLQGSHQSGRPIRLSDAAQANVNWHHE